MLRLSAQQSLLVCAVDAAAVMGDAFLARFFDNDDDFKRMDFEVSELDSSAPWMDLARLQVNYWPPPSPFPLDLPISLPLLVLLGGRFDSNCQSTWKSAD
jgi:hypothetical protein